MPSSRQPATTDAATAANLPVVAAARRLLDEHEVNLAGRRVLAMCSGGVDSVVLVDVLAALPRGARPASVQVLFCDHGLRDVRRDRAAASAAALRAGSPLRAERAPDVLASGGNRQARARTWRREVAGELAPVLDIDVVATGHTADDQLETILYGLVATSGTRGTSGIPAVTELAPGLPLVRPLLTSTRADVLAHARARGLDWAEDPTNADPASGRRAHLRHNVVPALLEAHPGAGSNLVRAVELSAAAPRAAEALADALLTHAARDGVLDAREVAALPPAAGAALVAAWLRSRGAGRRLTAQAAADVVALARRPRTREGGVVALHGACVRRDGYDLAYESAPRHPQE